MTANAKISATWYEIDAIHSRVGGSWKEVAEGYTKISGNWKQFYASSAPLVVNYLVIAGGGGGAGTVIGRGGGGGAGGYRTSAGTSGANSSAESSLTLSVATNYTVTVGAGGSGSTIGGATNGSNSVFGTITSSGGGYGGDNNRGGGNGGSGGGNAYNGAGLYAVGSGTANQGLDGGQGFNGSPDSVDGGGGGGGASQAGATAVSNQAGKGGDGLASTITGTSVTRAGGGGGGVISGGTAGAGGTGGGGAGGTGGAGTAGTINTGGAGGGGGSYTAQGGAGGSGVVIVKYPNTYAITVGAGLVSSTVTSGSYAITTFFSGTDTISFATGSPLSSPPVSGYSLWLDGADDSSFTYSSGALVSSWADKSGNGYDFAQATVGSQPTRLDDGFVSFDGSDDRLAAASKFMNAWHNGTSTTLFIVVNRTSTSGHLFGTESGASANIGASTYLGYALAVRRGVSGSNAVRLLSTTAQAAGEKAVWTIRTDADNGTAANRGYFYLNDGAAQQTNTDTGTPSASDSTYVPAIGGNGSYFGDGKVAEIIWYESDLSTSDREAVRDYLIEKWGIA